METPSTDPRLQPQKILRYREDEDGLGWEMDLACGHTVWCPVRLPPEHSYCGECLVSFTNEVREKQRK